MLIDTDRTRITFLTEVSSINRLWFLRAYHLLAYVDTCEPEVNSPYQVILPTTVKTIVHGSDLQNILRNPTFIVSFC